MLKVSLSLFINSVKINYYCSNLIQRISQRTAELQSGAENFASLANELVKTMERRKWWQI